MNPNKLLAIRAVGNMRGDDLWRARSAFKGKSDAQMQEQWGQSGKTCAQILAEYEQHEAKCDACIAWLNTL